MLSLNLELSNRAICLLATSYSTLRSSQLQQHSEIPTTDGSLPVPGDNVHIGQLNSRAQQASFVPARGRRSRRLQQLCRRRRQAAPLRPLQPDVTVQGETFHPLRGVGEPVCRRVQVGVVDLRGMVVAV